MQPEDFAHFYEAVHGYRPFPWQERLARELIEGCWPRTLALPTSSGKTSVLDVVVFALAAQAHLPAAQRTVPLRTCLVVDRRLVVDEAARHAQALADALAEAPNGLLAKVAAGLRRFGAPVPLRVATLRGGMYLDDAWAALPHQPVVITSTVDQVGSRLLFRGYGLSPQQWPVHAGLLGNDTLFVIDEAHLSQPFIDTLAAIERFRTWAEAPVITPFRVLVMSATPQTQDDAFYLDAADYAHPVLSARLDAAKPVQLLPAKLRKSKQTPEEFERIIIEEAQRLAASDDVRIVGVVVNQVRTARRVFEALRQQSEALLLTGRIRPNDRDRLLQQWLPSIKANRVTEPDRTLFVVATQTVEVGADISFDALVTETAPLNALRQRAGRLDRLGRRGLSHLVIVLREEGDPVYGPVSRDTHRWLIAQAKREMVDFGIRAFDRLLANAPEPPPQTDLEPAPVLLPALLEQWIQTSPVPYPNPDVAPFLHGPQRAGSDVQVVWRADLDEGHEEEWAEIVALLPPKVQEALPVPLPALLAWLRREEQPAVGDIEGAAGADTESGQGAGRRVLRWCGEDSDVITAREIRPGDTVVAPAAWGGCDRYGWHPDSRTTVMDIAEDCQQGRAVRVRIHPAVLGYWLAEEECQRAEACLRGYLAAVRDPDTEADLEELQEALLEALPTVLTRFGMKPRQVRIAPYPGERPEGLVLSTGASVTDEDDTSVLTRPVALDIHLDGVSRWCEYLTRQSGLPPLLIEDERLAGGVHDLGKADPRFQMLLYGGDEVAAIAGDLLAKSGMNPTNRLALRQAREHSGLPRGWRHEFMSVALLNAAVLGGAHDPDLVRYLVGVHHGRGRPFPPTVADPDPQVASVEYQGHLYEACSDHGLERLDGGWAELFWNLNRRYGYWGLAYLEALLRLADRARSQEEIDHD